MVCEIKQAVQSAAVAFGQDCFRQSKVWEACQVVSPWCKAYRGGKAIEKPGLHVQDKEQSC